MTAPSETNLAKIAAITAALRDQAAELTPEEKGLLAQALLALVCSLADESRRKRRSPALSHRAAASTDTLH